MGHSGGHGGYCRIMDLVYILPAFLISGGVCGREDSVSWVRNFPTGHVLHERVVVAGATNQGSLRRVGPVRMTGLFNLLGVSNSSIKLQSFENVIVTLSDAYALFRYRRPPEGAGCPSCRPVYFSSRHPTCMAGVDITSEQRPWLLFQRHLCNIVIMFL